MSRPVVFSCFSNKGNNLTNLIAEGQALRDLFQASHDGQILEYLGIDHSNKDDIYKNLNRFRHRLLIFHYAGHANDYLLELEDRPNLAQGLARALSNQTKLALVFLNGCSTKAQVDTLIDHQVPAVIATHRAIDDGMARLFSTTFYDALTKGNTLGEAFQLAQASVEGEVLGKDIAFQVVRGAGGRAAIPAESPWLLYVRAESILQWRLPTQATGAALDPIQAVIEAKVRELEEKYVELATKELEINARQQEKNLLDPATHQPIISFYEQQIHQLQQTVQSIQATIGDLEVGVFMEKKRSLEEVHLRQLRDDLRRINYSDQLVFLQESVKFDHNQLFGAFIIQGTPLSAHGFLIERLLNKAGIPLSENFSKIIRKDFAGISTEAIDESNIWEKIAGEFNLDPATSPSEIVRIVFERKLLRLYNLIFRFENLHFENVKHHAEVIKSFWFNFLRLAQQQTIDPAWGNKVLLFLSDVNCECKVEEGQYISGKELSYVQFLSKAAMEENRTFLLPVIKPLNLGDLQGCTLNLPVDFALTEARLQGILQKHQGVILPTIKELCSATETVETIYNLDFAKYEIKLPQV